MNILDCTAPGAGEILGLAEKCRAGLPGHMVHAARDIRIIVMDQAGDDLLDELEMDDPLELTGLYVGTPLTIESVSSPAFETPLIYLFRLPILLEWAMSPGVTLAGLVEHVFIHELGHHFGWSDEEMDATLRRAGE